MSPVAVRRGYCQAIDIATVAVAVSVAVAVRRGYSQVLEMLTVSVAVAVVGQTPHTPIGLAPPLGEGTLPCLKGPKTSADPRWLSQDDADDHGRMNKHEQH